MILNQAFVGSSKGRFRIFEILHHERQPPVAKQVGIADEKQFDLEFHRLPELQLVDRARANEVPLRADIDRLVGLAGIVIDLAAVEDVDLGDLDLLMNLLFREFLVARLINGRRFLPAPVRDRCA